MVNTTNTSDSTEKDAKRVAGKSVTELEMRDYFAAKWLQGWVANPDLPDMTPDKAAAQAYLVADAMLKAREAQ